MSVLSNPRIGPYMGVTRDVTRGRYRLAVYGAFNAFGLIGSEHNGIVVLDNDAMCVVADRLFQQDSGYFGPSKQQLDALQFLQTCTADQFCAVINESGRNRHDIDPSTVEAA